MKKVHFIICLFFIFVSIIHSSQYTGAFLNYGSSARAVALGNTGFVDNYDASSLYWNASLLSQINDRCLTFVYSSPFSKIDNITHNAVYYSDDFFFFKIAFGLIYQDVGSMQWTDRHGKILGSYSSKEYAYFTGVSYKINEFLSVGSNIKIISQKIFNYSTTGFGLDIGAFYNFNDDFKFSLSLKNLIQPSLKLNNQTEYIPFRLETGVSHKISDFTLLFGLTIFDDDIFAKSGIEYLYNYIFALRLGYESETDSFSTGVGINFDLITFDYTYKIHPDLGGSHFIGFNLVQF